MLNDVVTGIDLLVMMMIGGSRGAAVGDDCSHTTIAIGPQSSIASFSISRQQHHLVPSDFSLLALF